MLSVASCFFLVATKKNPVMKWGSRALGKPVTNGKSINKLIELERRKSARVVMCSRNVCLCVCVFSKAIDGFVAMHGNTSERDIGCLMIAANADVASVTRSELWFSQHTKYWARCCMRMFQMRSECESSSAANYLLWPLTKDEHTLCNIVAKPNMHFARVSWLVSVGWLSFFFAAASHSVPLVLHCKRALCVQR